MPLLEKFVEKIKQGRRGGVNSAPPRRQVQHQPKQKPVKVTQRQRPITSMVDIEGARATADSTFSPYSDTSRHAQKPAMKESHNGSATGNTNLKDAVVWSEILNNPKFKEF